ncbi:hypothetical protein Tco_0835545 [Tanacetum coccineum]
MKPTGFLGLVELQRMMGFRWRFGVGGGGGGGGVKRETSMPTEMKSEDSDNKIRVKYTDSSRVVVPKGVLI